MEELLKPALDAAFIKLDKVVSQTKNSFKYVDIRDVNILEFQEFLTDNNIPDTAWFSTCGEDGPFEVNTPCLVYDVVLTSSHGTIKCILTDIYFDDLFYIMHRHIEI